MNLVDKVKCIDPKNDRFKPILRQIEECKKIETNNFTIGFLEGNLLIYQADQDGKKIRIELRGSKLAFRETTEDTTKYTGHECTTNYHIFLLKSAVLIEVCDYNPGILMIPLDDLNKYFSL